MVDVMAAELGVLYTRYQVAMRRIAELERENQGLQSDKTKLEDEVKDLEEELKKPQQLELAAAE